MRLFCKTSMEALYWRLANNQDIPDNVKSLWREFLQEGKIFFYPTETLYGLGTAPYQEEWIHNLCVAKGRPENKPLPLIASSVEHARKAWVEWNPVVERLIDAFWPGPLTIVLKASSDLPDVVHGKTGKLGIRVSSHPLATFLAELAGGLIIATSANLSGEMPVMDPSLIPGPMKSFISVIIDGGVLAGLPSTVVDCSEGKFEIIREGVVSRENITAILEKAG